MLALIALIFALVCAILAAIGVPSPPRFNLLAAAVAFLVVYFLLVRAASGV